jgi:hypothetical protein
MMAGECQINGDELLAFIRDYMGESRKLPIEQTEKVRQGTHRPG